MLLSTSDVLGVVTAVLAGIASILAFATYLQKNREIELAARTVQLANQTLSLASNEGQMPQRSIDPRLYRTQRAVTLLPRAALCQQLCRRVLAATPCRVELLGVAGSGRRQVVQDVVYDADVFASLSFVHVFMPSADEEEEVRRMAGRLHIGVQGLALHDLLTRARTLFLSQPTGVLLVALRLPPAQLQPLMDAFGDAKWIIVPLHDDPPVAESFKVRMPDLLPAECLTLAEKLRVQYGAAQSALENEAQAVRLLQAVGASNLHAVHCCLTDHYTHRQTVEDSLQLHGQNPLAQQFHHLCAQQPSLPLLRCILHQLAPLGDERQPVLEEQFVHLLLRQCAGQLRLTQLEPRGLVQQLLQGGFIDLAQIGRGRQQVKLRAMWPIPAADLPSPDDQHLASMALVCTLNRSIFPQSTHTQAGQEAMKKLLPIMQLVLSTLLAPALTLAALNSHMEQLAELYRFCYIQSYARSQDGSPNGRNRAFDSIRELFAQTRIQQFIVPGPNRTPLVGISLTDVANLVCPMPPAPLTPPAPVLPESSCVPANSERLLYSSLIALAYTFGRLYFGAKDVLPLNDSQSAVEFAVHLAQLFHARYGFHLSDDFAARVKHAQFHSERANFDAAAAELERLLQLDGSNTFAYDEGHYFKRLSSSAAAFHAEACHDALAHCYEAHAKLAFSRGDLDTAQQRITLAIDEFKLLQKLRTEPLKQAREAARRLQAAEEFEVKIGREAAVSAPSPSVSVNIP